jgi:hypothetical protein
MPIGPSTTTAPYLVGATPNVQLTSLLTAGDALPADGVFAGTPDGLAAFDNGDGTFTLLVVHQLASSSGLLRDYGGTGSFIDRLVIDKATLRVTFADDLIQSMMRWSDSKDVHFAGVSRLSKLTSADLGGPDAFHNPASGLGTDARILLSVEESGTEGRVFATVASGPGTGVIWDLPFLGNATWETAVANPLAQDRTVVAITDDTTGGQLYFYIGDKQASGSDIVRAGLMGGDLYGLKVDGVVDEVNATPINGTFTLQPIGAGGDVSNMTGVEMEADSDARGITGFLRPEDAVWDPAHPNTLYFVTTASFNSNSRLYKVSFTDIARPELGGTIEALLTGGEGHRMLDNIEISGGKLILQEDPGNTAYIARVWEYDLASDSLTPLAQFDPARFTPGSSGFIGQYEESSGILDVTGLLGDADTRAYLTSAQVHVATNDPATVQLGQLMLMTVDQPPPTPPTTKLVFSSAIDTYIKQSGPTSTNPTASTLKIDGDAGLAYQTLLAFTGLFGDGPDQIPLGATITSAMVALNTTNSSATGASLYRMTNAWSDRSSWSSLGNGIQVGTETAATADLVVRSVKTGMGSFDVTASLTAWLNGATTPADANAANKGWAFLANGTDGWDFSSFESAYKPQLTVSFILPAATPAGAPAMTASSLAASSSTADAAHDWSPDSHHDWQPPDLATHHMWNLDGFH